MLRTRNTTTTQLGAGMCFGVPYSPLQVGAAEGSTSTRTSHECLRNTDANDISLSVPPGPHCVGMNPPHSPGLRSSFPGAVHWLAPISLFNWTFILFSSHKGLGLFFRPASILLNYPSIIIISVFQIFVTFPGTLVSSEETYKQNKQNTKQNKYISISKQIYIYIYLYTFLLLLVFSSP